MEYQRATQSAHKEQSKTPPSSPQQTSPNHVAAHPLLKLQRIIGNQAVQNMLRSQKMQIDASPQGLREPHLGHDFSRIPIHSTQTAAPQTKLKVNQPRDVYEQEADQVAEQVMGMTDQGPSVADDKNEEKPSLMRKQSREPQAGTATEAPPIVHEVLSSGQGQPLDATTRAFMEPRFGHDFSQVRVHTDERAPESAQAMNALAYTVGRDMVFEQGQYKPETHEGRRLLAHELTHVVQQSSADGNSVGQSNEKRGLSVISNSVSRLGVTIQRDTTKSETKPSTKEKKEERFPWIGRIHGTFSAALRSTPHKDPDDPHVGTVADLAEGTVVHVFERKGGWLHVRASASGKEVEGYVSQELVAVSPAKGLKDEDPRKDPHYIDALFQTVNYSWLSGASVFHWQENGKEKTIGIPFIELEQDDTQTFVPIFEVHTSKDEALKTVKKWANMSSSFTYYSFYRTPDNIIMPTSFSINSAPKFHELWPELKQQIAKNAEDIRKGLQPLAGVVNPFPGTRIDEHGNIHLSSNPLDWLGLLLHLPKLRLLSETRGAGPRKPSPEPLLEPNIPKPKEPLIPRRGEAVVHIGGELEAKAGEIVINPGRKAMPLTTVAKETGAVVLKAKAEAIPLEAGVASKVLGRKLPSNIDWKVAASEIARILKPGGTIEISTFGPDAEVLAKELQANGIHATVDPLSKNHLVTGVKPN